MLIVRKRNLRYYFEHLCQKLLCDTDFVPILHTISAVAYTIKHLKENKQWTVKLTYDKMISFNI